MAHWIIEDYGFGGQVYRCSNCRTSWNDLYYSDILKDNCPECGEFIDEDENEYVDNPNKHKTDDVIMFPQTIGSITYYNKEELFKWVENQQAMNKWLNKVVDKWNDIPN